MSRLEALNLSGCHRLFRSGNNEMFPFLATKVLRHLDLSYLRVNLKQTLRRDRTFTMYLEEYLTKGLPHLRVLKLNNNFLTSFSGIGKPQVTAQNLVQLDISRISLPPYMENLEPVALESFADATPNLRTLLVVESQLRFTLRDEPQRKPLNKLNKGEQTRWIHLRVLDCHLISSGVDKLGNPNPLSYDDRNLDLIRFAVRCPSLRELRMNGNCGGLEVMKDHTLASHLRLLHAADSYGGEKARNALAQVEAGLEELDLSSSFGTGPELLFQDSFQNRNYDLRCLRLNGRILTNCVALESVDCEGCLHIPTQLRQLAITKDEVEKLRRAVSSCLSFQ